VGIFLAKDGHQNIRTRHFFFTAARGLNVHDGALNHTLKTQRGLCVYFFSAGNLRCVVFDERRQRLTQIVDLCRTRTQHLCCAGVVQQCQQQMFHGDELVTLLTRLNEGHVQTDFQFLGNHVISLNALRRVKNVKLGRFVEFQLLYATFWLKV